MPADPMPAHPTPPRTALVAGGTGLIGSHLLSLLRAEPVYRRVHVLLRRPVDDLAGDARIAPLVVDYNALPDLLPAVDDVYIALGTTIKVAGSQDAFRRVDLDHVVSVARAARAAGAQRLGVVSALGADARSPMFYNRVKGEMEAAVASLGYESVTIVQPSLLIGDRDALGQPGRPGEVWATRLLRPWMRLVPRGVRPIGASAVAQALARSVMAGAPGVRRLGSGAMQP